MNKHLSITLLFCALLIHQVTGFAAPAPKDVNVVNTPDVNVVSMPPVEATVSGPVDANITEPVEVTAPGGLDVNVQNMPGVTIENGPLEPIPVTTNVYQRIPTNPAGDVLIRAGRKDGLLNIYTVPDGKYLYYNIFFIG